jgi:probable F420-dependent oxidoreductase
MRFGTRLYGTRPDDVVARAQEAEALGFDSVWRGDHLILPETLRTPYPNSADGTPPFDMGAPVLDVLTVLAFVAQATSTIRLATGIYILPLREPVAVARTVQTLDVLSGGRVVFGCGAGWMREEYEIVGRDFDRRGSALTESIETLTALWDDPVPCHAGHAVRFEPKPMQRPRPPVVVGGESPAALRRAARVGDGWYGHVADAATAAARVATLTELRRHAGRAALPFEVTTRVAPDVGVADVRRLEEAGVDRLVLEVGGFADERDGGALDVMRRFADRFLA